MDDNKILNERYEIKEILGRGGFATTYLAVDTETQQKCAIKCLSFRKIEEWKTWELFEREAKILKELDHPQIPKHIDFFSRETDEDVELYLIQEYVEGKSLGQLVREGKHFNEQEVIEIGLEITSILEYLHSFSPPIIHRDIKPSNIILTQFPSRADSGLSESGVGLVYLIDFGAVREKMISDYSTIGGGSTIVGTYGYMPIEQFEGRALPASDIFSLGNTLIYLLSGKEPVEIEKKGESLNYRPHVNVSRSFTVVLDKMITREYKRRYQTALQVNKDLKRLKSGKRVFNVRFPAKTFVPVAVVIAILIGWFASSLLTSPIQPPQSEKTPLQPTQTPRSSSQLQITPISSPSPDSHTFETLLQQSRVLSLSHKSLEALVVGVKAGKYAQNEELPATSRRQAIAHLLALRTNIHEKIRLEVPEDILHLAFSPDGRMLASGVYGKDKPTIKIWNVEDGRQIESFQESFWSVTSFRFGSDGEIQLTPDAFTKRIKFGGYPSADLGHESGGLVQLLSFNPDRTLLATGSEEGTITIWNLKENRAIKTLPGHAPTPVECAEFSPDSTLLASGSSDKTIKIWNLSDGQELMTLHGHAGWVRRVVFSSDGKLLASASDDKTIRLWDVLEGQEIRTLSGHDHRVLSVAFSPDNTLIASGSLDHTIKLWNVSNGREIITLHGHSRIIDNVLFSPDGMRLASASGDKTIRIWELTNLPTLQGNSNDKWGFTFSPDSSLLASASKDKASEDKTITLWNVSDGRQFKTLHGHSDDVSGLIVFSQDGKLLASGSNDSMIKLWDIASGQKIKTLQSRHKFGVCHMTFSPDSTLLASNGCGDEEVRVWNVAEEREILTLDTGSGMVRHVTFSPDGKILASGSTDTMIKLWNVADGREKMTLQGHKGGVKWLVFSPDGMLLASGSHDNTIKFWDVASGKLIKTLEIPFCPVTKMAFNPDWTMLVAICEFQNILRIWDVEDESELTILPGGYWDAFSSVTLSPDGKLLAFGSFDNKTIKIMNFDLNNLLLRSCEWLHGYLKNNPTVSEEDRTVCDDILAAKDAKKR